MNPMENQPAPNQIGNIGWQLLYISNHVTLTAFLMLFITDPMHYILDESHTILIVALISLAHYMVFHEPELIRALRALLSTNVGEV